MSEKTEQPTPKKLRDARKKGQVAKSKEIATCAAIVGMFCYLWLFSDHFLTHISAMLTLPTKYYQVAFEKAYMECIKGCFYELLLLSVPIVMTAMVLAVISYMGQFGFLLAFESIKPDFNKLNPVEGIKRIFSMNNLLELVKSIIKILLLCIVVFLLIKAYLTPLTHIPRYGIQGIVPLLASALKQLIIQSSVIFIVIAVLDYFLQQYLHIKKLKMSMDEVKREHKESEGDPHIKGKRKEIQMELLNDDMKTKIETSTVIVADSKKIAVAIYYQYGKVSLPVVMVKGKNLLAQKIITMARQFNLPIHQDAALAKKLSAAQENNFIPLDLIEPVAMVLRSLQSQ